MNLGWGSTGGGQSGPATAAELPIEDAGGLFPALTGADKNVEKALVEAITKANSAFQQANDGKNSVEAAVIGKGGTVSKQGAIATYAELVAGIVGIAAGGKFATGTIIPIGVNTTQPGYENDNKYYDKNGATTPSNARLFVNTLDFTPDAVILIRDISALTSAKNYSPNISYWISGVSNWYLSSEAKYVNVFRTIDRSSTSSTTLTTSENIVSYADGTPYGNGNSAGPKSNGFCFEPRYTYEDNERAVYTYFAYKKPV